MEKTPQNIPEDFEPTIRINREEIEQASPVGRPFSRKKKRLGIRLRKMSLHGFIGHISGMFRRRNNSVEPVPLLDEERKVSLKSIETDAFPPLENAYDRANEFGAGGQAKLFRGFDRHLHRMVAVKSLREEFSDSKEARDKFVEEAMITAQLDHPAIVPVYSIHRDNTGNLHLAMKLINGRPFQAYLADLVRHYQRNGLSTGEERRSLNYRLDVFLSVCDALEYAHNHNIMHCDLKPENIMIGEYHEAYLMDWGLARWIDDPAHDPESWEAPKEITGTPRFLPPEALCGEYCDQRADIYTLGLILYEIVTLQYAYNGSNHKETMNRIRRGEMRPVHHRFGYPIPVDLRKIILKAAAWDRNRRYKSVSELSTDLRRFIRGEEVSANPDTIFGKIARIGYRHRRFMTISSLTLVTIGALSAAFSLYDRVAAGILETHRTEFRQARQQEMLEKLGEVISVGRSLDRQISKLEFDLFSVATEAVMVTNSNIPTDPAKKVWEINDLQQGNRPESMIYAPGFGRYIDLEHPVCHIPPGSKPLKWKERMQKLMLIKPRMEGAVLGSRNSITVSPGNIDLIKSQVIKSGAPLASIYLGFSDGLFVTYPGEVNIAPNYDHRKRHWYRAGLTKPDRNGNSIRWGSPYLSVNGELVFTCAAPMLDTNGKIHGVAGADISLPQMIESLQNKGNTCKSLIAKSIVDSNGNIIADIGPQFLNESKNNYTVKNGELRLVRYNDRKLFNRMKQRHTGYVIRREGDFAVAYVFSKLLSVNWFYIEKFDLEKLLMEEHVAIPDFMNAEE